MNETLNDWVARCNAPGADADTLVRERDSDTLDSLVREVFGAADYKRGAFTLSVLAETRWFKRAEKVLAAKSQETIAVDDMRWGINVLLEKIAQNLEGWPTWDIWRSDAAMVVRGFKNDATAPAPPPPVAPKG